MSGRAIYARNFEVDDADAQKLLTERVGAEFTHQVFEAAGGLGWHSPALTDRDRGIAIIAALVTQNVTDDRLRTCLSLSRRNGVDEQGLTSLMVLLAAYVGQPYASLAMEMVLRSAGLATRSDRRRGRSLTWPLPVAAIPPPANSSTPAMKAGALGGRESTTATNQAARNCE